MSIANNPEVFLIYVDELDEITDYYF